MATQAEIDRAIADGKKDMTSTESATRRRLQARYASSMELIEAELRTIALQLDAMDAGDLIGPRGGYTRQGRLWRQQHLERLLNLMDQEYTRNAALGAQDVAQAQREAVSTGQQTARNMGLEGGVGPALNTEAYDRLVSATGHGSPVRSVMEAYGPIAQQVIERRLIEGIMQGHGADRIIRGIRSEIGTTGVPPWRLEALVRTESMRAFRGSLTESYKALGVEQVRWTAALSPRTCLACLGRHGDLFPADYQMDAHVNCRCVLSPYTGQPTDRISGEEWLRRQPEAVQRKKLGEAFDAFQRGDVGLKDFIGQRQSRTWGKSIYEMSPRQAMRGREAIRTDARYTTKPTGNDPADFVTGMNKRPRDLEIKETLREGKAGLDAIRAVHGMPDGTAPVAFELYESSLSNGSYSRIPQHVRTPGGGFARDDNGDLLQTNVPHSLGLENRAFDPRGAYVHEYGHYLDDQVLGKRYNSYKGAIRGNGSATEAAPIKRWRNAVQNSRGYKALSEMPDGGDTMWIDGRQLTEKQYLIQDNETWARSYFQYVAKKTQDPVLLQIVKDYNTASYKKGWQWDDEDFDPIERAIDDILADLGMIEKVP